MLVPPGHVGDWRPAVPRAEGKAGEVTALPARGSGGGLAACTRPALGSASVSCCPSAATARLPWVEVQGLYAVLLHGVTSAVVWG